MDLDEYLIRLDRGNTLAPDKLTLQPSLVKQLLDLYTLAEARGLERGGPLLCDRAHKTFTVGQVAEGLKTSMNIPVTTDPANFGDVHAHPSTSIGHVGGYSAHSMDDLLNFKKTSGKPFWIQFVASGPWVYAMTQVKGVSKWDETAEKFLRDRSVVEQHRMLDTVVTFVGGEAKWAKKLKQLGSDPSEAEYVGLYETYKAKAQVGALMQHLSVKHCAEFARDYNFFFYTGNDGTLTRMLSAPV